MCANPWVRLPELTPFVLPEDAEAVRAFNERASEAHRLRVGDLLPEPFMGDPSAPLVILGNNPGFSEEGVRLKREPGFATRLRANLLHEPSDYPFVFLAPDAPARPKRWWERKLRGLLHLGHATVARSVLAVEHFPYGSERYGRAPRVPSQEYSFGLVRRAVERKALVVLVRGGRRWRRDVPELGGYPGLCVLNNPMAGTISRRNCPRFEDILCALGGDEASADEHPV